MNYTSYYRADRSLWVERLVDFWCRKALRHRSKRNVHRAMPEDGASLKEGPYPRREGTKANYKTIGK